MNIESLNPTHINQLHLTTSSGKGIHTILPSGGFGISRYTLDHYLYLQLIEKGVTVIADSVIDVSFNNDEFTANTSKKRQL